VVASGVVKLDSPVVTSSALVVVGRDSVEEPAPPSVVTGANVAERVMVEGPVAPSVVESVGIVGVELDEVEREEEVLSSAGDVSEVVVDDRVVNRSSSVPEPES